MVFVEVSGLVSGLRKIALYSGDPHVYWSVEVVKGKLAFFELFYIKRFLK